MALFAYRALDARQSLVAGTIAADSPLQARQTLRAQGLTIAQLETARSRKSQPLRRGPGLHEVAELWRNLAVLLRAGVPLAVALETCRAQQPGPLRTVLQEIHESISAGRTLAEALESHPRLADEITRTMIAIGQHSGNLPDALLELAEYQTRRRGLANQFATALIYPVILCAVGTGVVIFLMSYVVPQLVDVLTAAGRELPWPTRVLLTFSQFVTGYAWILASFAIVLAAGTVATWRLPPVRRMRERLSLAIPVWSELVRKIWVARIAGMLATLLRVDARFTEALRIVRGNLSHGLYEAELQRLETGLEAGAALSAPLRESRLIPPLVVHLLAVGQESGELPAMLEQLRSHYEKEVGLALGRFVAVLEPALILVLATVIGFVVFATLLPIIETTRIAQ